MKKTKIIIPALGVLLLSTAASVTGTVAWFSMNNFVTASGMNIQAKAESGIVISDEAQTSWTDSATASHNTALAVLPTSTADASSWVHSQSNNANSATSTGAYEMLDIEVDAGRGYHDADDDQTYDNTEDFYFLKNSFYIKSSATALNAATIYITNVYASVSGSTNSGELNKALRVLVKSGTTAKVFAPISGATATYTVVTSVGNPNTTSSVTAIDSSATEGHVPAASQSFLASHDIPAFASTEPTQVDIYVYFEGEDANCKSANLVASLDTLQVSVKFGLQSVPDPANP